jgi:indolepyruvate ferredoxin oxidoreductase beta subunit
VGPFKGSLIGSGRADLMLVLDEGSMEIFIHLLSPEGALLLNAPNSPSHPAIDATGLAAAQGSPLMANLVLLGFALKKKILFCDYPLAESVTGKISPPRFREANLQALQRGYSFSEKTS